ncbi:kinase-like domain-containing protein [Mycena crocata]|nr:kinase-like domain-containing protein [Mycena crocata]
MICPSLLADCIDIRAARYDFIRQHLQRCGAGYQSGCCYQDHYMREILDPTGESPTRYTSPDSARAPKDSSILQTLKHPHVLEILSVFRGEPNEPTNLVLEYVSGDELICRDIMYQLCQAMAYVHLLGIVHRNLKHEWVILLCRFDIPQNILVSGDRIPFIKVAGFGLSVRSEGNRLHQIRGSLEYMAPEMIRPSSAGYDHRCEALSNLLCEDPDMRCSLEDALAHPWLGQHRPMYPVTNIIMPSEGLQR